MTSEAERSKVKVIRSRRQSDACLRITRQRKVAETTVLAGRLSVSRLTFSTSSKVKKSKVKVIRPLNAVTDNQPYLRNGRPANHHLLHGGREHIMAAAQLVINIAVNCYCSVRHSTKLCIKDRMHWKVSVDSRC